MYRFLFVVTAAVALVACDRPPSAPDPALRPSLSRATSERMSFSTVATNPCPPTPELVPLTGTIHIVVKPEETPEGVRLLIHRNTHATGLGTITGVKYVFQGISKQEVFPNLDPRRFDSEILDRFHEIPQGPADNFFFALRTRVTCDQTGCRAEALEQETSCRG